MKWLSLRLKTDLEICNCVIGDVAPNVSLSHLGWLPRKRNVMRARHACLGLVVKRFFFEQIVCGCLMIGRGHFWGIVGQCEWRTQQLQYCIAERNSRHSLVQKQAFCELEKKKLHQTFQNFSQNFFLLKYFLRGEVKVNNCDNVVARKCTARPKACWHKLAHVSWVRGCEVGCAGETLFSLEVLMQCFIFHLYSSSHSSNPNPFFGGGEQER